MHSPCSVYVSLLNHRLSVYHLDVRKWEKKNEESHFVAGSRISPDKMTPAFSSRALEGFSRAKLRRLPKRHQIPATQSRPVGGRVMGSAEQEGRSRRGARGRDQGAGPGRGWWAWPSEEGVAVAEAVDSQKSSSLAGAVRTWRGRDHAYEAWPRGEGRSPNDGP